MLNRKFVRTDDTMKDSLETAKVFNVSQTSHNLNKALVFVAMQPFSSYTAGTHACTHAHTHTQSQLYSIPRAAMPRGIMKSVW